jgi:squalene-hopene cyclase-like protein
MRRFNLERFANQIASLEGAAIALWIGLAVLSVTLFVLSRTRWGQERPLRKCLVLSILAHVLLMGYATTVKIVAGIPVRDPAPIVHISLDEGNPRETASEEAGAQLPSPWASHHHDAPSDVNPLDLERADVASENESSRRSQADELGTAALAPLDRVAMVAPIQPDPDSPQDTLVEQESDSTEKAAPIDAPAPERRDAPGSRVPDVESERIEVAATEGETPNKPASTARIASLVLQERVPLPRLSNLPVTVEPNRVLAGPIDTMTEGHGQPADLEETVAPTASSEVGNLQPSSLTAAATPAASSLAGLTSLEVSDLIEVTPIDMGSDMVGGPALGQARLQEKKQDVPRVYRLRVAPNRSEIALRYGATNESEAAVRAALKWLADNQERDGRWNPDRHHGGKERRVLGRDRFGAGAQADTGISALALLAFLASGHTQEEGLYRENVQRGLEFLVRSQASDGNLGGRASTYAFMYCHAMATFALSEAYGMTTDRQLEGAVRRAVMYTVTAQNPTTGGWRYNVGDEGDTSQLGWQLMALKSADLAGIPMPAHTRQGAIRYLKSVSSGWYGGLAAYRPVEEASRPMTAEALACRHFLEVPPDSRMAGEASQYLLAEVPGEGEPNFYYWYYATLGLYQTQSEAWDHWNAALQRELLSRQRDSGDMAGSWDPDTVWGGYGGRVYTTALATLCLEVYYRFMPLYVQAAASGQILR